MTFEGLLKHMELKHHSGGEVHFVKQECISEKPFCC